MATELNILMKQYNGVDYDTLYPKTKAENVENVYNKQEVLSDATKGLFQLPLEAVPDNVFNQLYQYLFGTDIQEYRWLRTKTEWVESTPIENVSIRYPLENNRAYFYYSSSYKIDSQGQFQLNNPNGITYYFQNYEHDNSEEIKNTLNGKYFTTSYTGSNVYSAINGIYVSGANPVTVTITEVSQLTSQQKTTNEIVTSTNPNAYPDSGTQDGWTYTKLPPILNKVGLITVGNYQGTGKSGANNKNSITTQYPPKVLVVMQENGTGLGSGAGIFWVGQSKMNANTFVVSGNTVNWYASQAGAQMNTSGVTYHYLVIC